MSFDDQSSVNDWSREAERTVNLLNSAEFDGVVLDYDGTLCDPRFRFESLPLDIAKELERLLNQGALMGIATGRGKSVRKALRDSLTPLWWPQLTIGYYNCSQIATLGDDSLPDGTDRGSPALQQSWKKLVEHPQFCRHADIECRNQQLTISPKISGHAGHVRALAIGLLASEINHGIKVVHSTHSIAVLAPGVSKLCLISHMERSVNRPLTFLRIGDLGQWPGNDFELLASPFGLSCYRISGSKEYCWNLAPLGVRFSQATVGFLRMLRRSKKQPDKFSFSLRSHQ